MSALGDALTALKNVVLMQERLDAVNKRLDRMSQDFTGLGQYAAEIDKRVVRIETMIEMSGRGAGRTPRIEK